MKYRDLNASPRRTLAEIVGSLSERATTGNTGAHGTKHMGMTGDQLWYRPDGREISVREVDEALVAAQDRIDEAATDLEGTQIRLEQAEQDVATVSGDLDRVETVVIPGAVEALEQADAAAQEQFDELDTRLGDFATDESLGPIREALADAQDAVDAAKSIAETANQAANAASQAALEAAGIAASKGRVIIQETEPVGEDRNAANIWIKPIPDDPDTEVEEKSVTYVYFEASDSWEPTTSSELAQAAQNALDAREAAQQATQRAETAISNAATAQSAAEAAQRTADQATTDARDAHNEAVAAQGDATEALEKYGPLDQRTIDAQAAADAAQARAEEAYAEAASKLDESQVDAKIATSANGKNSITRKTVAPTTSAADRGVVAGDAWYRVDGNGDAMGMWIWSGSAWVASKVRNEMIDTIDVNKLKVHNNLEVVGDAVIEKLWADGIAARAVTASKIVVANSSESIILNSLLLEDQEFWTGSGATQRVVIAGVEGVTHALRSSKGSGTVSPYNGPTFPVTPGGTYLFEFWMRADVAGSHIFIELRDQDGNHASGRTAQGAKGPNRQLSPNPSSETNYLIGSEPVPTAWTKYQVQVNMNTETTLARVASFYFNHAGGSVTNAQVWVAGMSLRPMASSVLIEDGAITTPKLTVTGGMSAAIVDAMTVNTKKLVVSEEAILNHATLIGQTVVDDINVQGKLIGTNGVFTGTVDFANVNVTGTQIVNKLGANSISADKIKGGSFAGNTFTGGVFKGGEFQAPADPRWNGGVAIDPKNGIRGWNTSGEQTFGINGTSNFFSGTISTGREGRPSAILTPVTGGGGKVGGGVWFSTNGSLGNDQAAIYSYLDGNIHIRPKDTIPKGTVFIDGNLSVGDKTTFSSTLSAASITSFGTLSTMKPGRSTSSTANARIEPGSGVIRMTASSRRYKQEIEDWEPSAEDVLKLQPRSWKEKPGLRPDMPDYQDPNRYVGFIAEEVAEAGLEELVVFEEDEDGNYGPDNLNYDRIPAAHQVVLRDHEARIIELEERLAALENGDD